MRRHLALLAVAAAVLAFAVPAALAGKGGSPSIWLLQGPGQAPSAAVGSATFGINQTKTDQPWVRTDCYVNGTLAYRQRLGYFSSWQFGQTFYFNSNYLDWNYLGDPLSCTATLEWLDGKGAEHELATTSFTAYSS